MKNELIDVLGAFVSTRTSEERWIAAEELSKQFGIKSLLVAEVESDTKDFAWLNTNLPDTWMDEYLDQGYVEVDPFVARLGTAPGTAIVESATLKREDTVNQKEWTLNHALKDAGVGSMFCSNFSQPGQNGKLITLSFEQDIAAAFDNAPIEVTLFSALLAAVLGPSDAPSNKQFIRNYKLTTRQREVLSCLAEGMMNARIAEKLGITEASVAFHLANARRALGASTREHALALALKHGLISL